MAGADQWRERLAHHVADIEATLGGHPTSTSSPSGAAAGSSATSRPSRRLAAFVADLAEQVQPPEPGLVGGFAAWAIALVDRYLGAEHRRSRLARLRARSRAARSGHARRARARSTRSAPRSTSPVSGAPSSAPSTPRRHAVGTLRRPACSSARSARRTPATSTSSTSSARSRARFRRAAARTRCSPTASDARVEGLRTHRERRDRGAPRVPRRARGGAGERILCFARADARAQRRRSRRGGCWRPPAPCTAPSSAPRVCATRSSPSRGSRSSSRSSTASPPTPPRLAGRVRPPQSPRRGSTGTGPSPATRWRPARSRPGFDLVLR